MTSRTPDEHPGPDPGLDLEPGAEHEPGRDLPTGVAAGSQSSPDPEDWASTAGSGDDERYLRERPPHWE